MARLDPSRRVYLCNSSFCNSLLGPLELKDGRWGVWMEKGLAATIHLTRGQTLRACGQGPMWRTDMCLNFKEIQILITE